MGREENRNIMEKVAESDTVIKLEFFGMMKHAESKENLGREENRNIMEKVAESDGARKLEFSGMMKSAKSENLELTKIINCDIRCKGDGEGD